MNGRISINYTFKNIFQNVIPIENIVLQEINSKRIKKSIPG